jgi:hypothetical protein
MEFGAGVWRRYAARRFSWRVPPVASSRSAGLATGGKGLSSLRDDGWGAATRRGGFPGAFPRWLRPAPRDLPPGAKVCRRYATMDGAPLRGARGLVARSPGGFVPLRGTCHRGQRWVVATRRRGDVECESEAFASTCRSGASARMGLGRRAEAVASARRGESFAFALHIRGGCGELALSGKWAGCALLSRGPGPEALATRGTTAALFIVSRSDRFPRAVDRDTRRRRRGGCAAGL